MILAWALGVSLFTHTMMFIAVSYFGQIQVLWWLLIAMLASLYSGLRRRRRARVPAAARPAPAPSAGAAAGTAAQVASPGGRLEPRASARRIPSATARTRGHR
jgi:hypothetical protein